MTSTHPRRNQWSLLPNPPTSLGGDNELRAVWTGRRIVYLRTSDVSPGGALSYDPRTRTWTTLPSAFVGYYRKALVRDRGTAAAIAWTADATTNGIRWARLDRTRSRWTDQPRMWPHPSFCSMFVTQVGHDSGPRL